MHVIFFPLWFTILKIPPKNLTQNSHGNLAVMFCEFLILLRPYSIVSLNVPDWEREAAVAFRADISTSPSLIVFEGSRFFLPDLRLWTMDFFLGAFNWVYVFSKRPNAMMFYCKRLHLLHLWHSICNAYIWLFQSTEMIRVSTLFSDCFFFPLWFLWLQHLTFELQLFC